MADSLKPVTLHYMNYREDLARDQDEKLQIFHIYGNISPSHPSSASNFPTLFFGLSIGWVSPSIPQLLSPESPLPSGPISVDEASWVSSIPYLSGAFGTVIFGWLVDHLGRKYSVYIGAVPNIIAWLLIAFANNVIYLYISRVFIGIAAGAVFVTVPLFVAEIAENSIRGILGSILGILVTVGILIGQVICTYMKFFMAPYVMLGMCIFFFAVFPVFPDTPQYLLRRNRSVEAEDALNYYRGVNQESEGDLLAQVNQEMEQLRQEQVASTATTSITMADFRSLATRKALVIATILFMGRNMCGLFPLINFTESIFRASETTLDYSVSTFIVSTLAILACILCTVLVDRTGRRLVLIASCGGSALGLLGLGVFFLVKSEGVDVSLIGWFPLVTFSIFVFLANFGVVTVPHFVGAEILTFKIRGIVFSIMMLVSWPLLFLLTHFFLIVAEEYEMYYFVFAFFAWCVFQTIYTIFWVPETKGRSLEEISSLMVRHS
ncbi:facilitated trehalose transporter Tret1-like [Phlebotomus argentipes]|uniref:facilitated trehalose transporter Tret1-like n=1 Tax=Phlebotomus argentipes TaxID=94469 RepID=UPI0028936988|nr:facilitated trehalose transporter Tret1-like [Phlebotomus argentipes]